MKKLLAVVLGLLLLGATGSGVMAEGTKVLKFEDPELKGKVLVQVTVPESMPDFLSEQFTMDLAYCLPQPVHVHVITHEITGSKLVVATVALYNEGRWRIVAAMVRADGQEDFEYFEDKSFFAGGAIMDTLMPGPKRNFADLMEMVKKNLGGKNL